MENLLNGWTKSARAGLRRGAALPFDLVPIRRELAGYDRATFRSDLSAALNLALLTLPMSMAIALMIGMPVTAGILGGAVAAVIGPVFGCSRFVAPGPTNGTAALMLSAFLGLTAAGGDHTALVVPMVLLTGAILIAAAFLRVANFTGFISRTVVTAYVTCAAERIITNQLPLLLGVDIGGDNQTFVSVVSALARKLGQISPACVLIALGTWLLQSLLNRWRPGWPNLFLTLAIVSVVSSAAVRYAPEWVRLGDVGFLRAAHLGFGDWNFAGVPADRFGKLISPAMAMAFLCMLEASSIGRSLAAQQGERINGHEVLFGMGMANVASSLCGGLPVSGSLTRSAAAIAAGARTAFSGVMSGALIAVIGLTLGPWFTCVPTAALGAVVCRTALALFSPADVRTCLSATGADKAVYLLTFAIGLVAPLDTAIYFGVGLSIVLFLRRAAAPEIVEYAYNDQGHLAEVRGDGAGLRRDPEVSIVHVEGNLFFGAADLFTEQTRRVAENPDLRVLVLKFRNAHHLDATGLMLLTELHASMAKRGRHLLICELRGEIIRVMRDAGVVDKLGRDNLFVDTPANPPLSAARALRRAKRLLGGANARVSVYAKPAAGAPARAEARASVNILPGLYEDKPDFYGEL